MGLAWRARLLWQAVAVVATAGLLVVLRQLQPMAWLLDDKRNQYLPVAMDIGRRLRDGEFPNIDPDLGSGGNYAIDLQYGIYEPTHLLVAVGLSHLNDLALAAFLWSLLYQVVFAWGTTCLALRLKVSGPWAATAGAAAATSGYVFYWLMPNWMPGLVSIAWLPWLWWAWVGRVSPLRCLALGIFSYLVIAGGWPATWLMFAALGLGVLAEAVVTRGQTQWRELLVPLLARSVSVLGGAIAAALTVLPLLGAASSTVRNDKIANTNFLVANLADVFGFASPGLHGDLQTFGHQTTLMIPVFFTAWFAVAVLWLLDWQRGLLRSPGVIAGLVGCGLMLALTQAPSTLGPLRDPIRSLAGAQFFFVVTVVALVGAGRLVVTRTRLAAVGLSLAATAWLTWARDPQDTEAVLAVLAVAVAVGCLCLGVARAGHSVGGWVALGGTLVLAWLSFQVTGLSETDQQHASTLPPGPISFSASDRPVLASYRQASIPAMEQWFDDGVGSGFARLSEQTRYAPGYSSVRQKGFSDTFCAVSSHGDTCDRSLQQLFATEPRTGSRWIDLLGYRSVVVTGHERKAAWRKLAAGEWRSAQQGDKWIKFARVHPLDYPGRVTATIGSADVAPVRILNDTQSYDVSTTDGATLVFRDLFWPGYTATLDGEPIAVTKLQGTLVTVALPAGSQGRLVVAYGPVGPTAIAGLSGAGTALVALGMLTAWWWRRRVDADESASGSVDAEHEKDEPDQREPLQHPV